MKTTLELPDALMKRVKPGTADSRSKRRTRAPKPLRLKLGRRPSIDDIEAAIGSGRD